MFEFEVLYPNLIFKNFIEKFYPTKIKNKLVIDDDSDFHSDNSINF